MCHTFNTFRNNVPMCAFRMKIKYQFTMENGRVIRSEYTSINGNPMEWVAKSTPSRVVKRGRKKGRTIKSGE